MEWPEEALFSALVNFTLRPWTARLSLPSSSFLPFKPSVAVTRRSDEWGAQTLTWGVSPCSVSSPSGSRPETQGAGQVRAGRAAETWVWMVREARGGAAGLGSWESSRGTGGSKQGAT